MAIKPSQIYYNPAKTHIFSLLWLKAFNEMNSSLLGLGVRPLVNSLLTLKMLLEKTTINTDLTSRLLSASQIWPSAEAELGAAHTLQRRNNT